MTSWPPLLGPADLYQPMEDAVVPLFFNSYLYLPKDPHIWNGLMAILLWLSRTQNRNLISMLAR